MRYTTNIKEILQRIISGSELTTSYTDNKKTISLAWIDKSKEDSLEIPYNIAEWFIINGIVSECSGNMILGEMSYYSSL
jgi:hypothetical protein